MKRIACKNSLSGPFGVPLPCLMLVLMLLSGCTFGVSTPTEPLEPPFDEEVLESLLGSTKKDVQQKLGPPEREILGADKSYFIYRGRVDVSGLSIIVVVPIPSSGDTLVCSKLEFDADQHLMHFETYGLYVEHWSPSPWVSDDPRNCEEAFWSFYERRKIQQAHKTEIKNRAHEGDPEAMYEYGWSVPVERLRWYCLAAQNGHGTARYLLGHYYHQGLAGLEKNLGQAYVWYALALEANHADAARHKERLLRDMTPEQIAEAERVVTAWKPDPEECEVYAAEGQN